jgi:hypothetical protein
MKSVTTLSNILIILLIFLINSDCNKAKEEVPYEFQYHPCQYARTVWIGMEIDGLYPGNGDSISTTSPTLKWIHKGLGLYNGNYGCKYDVYLGTDPYLMNRFATAQTKDTITLSGLIFNQTYYWNIVAN